MTYPHRADEPNTGNTPDHHEASLQDPARLAALDRLEIMDTVAESAFDRLTRLACSLLKVPVALVSLVDANRQFFKSAVGLPEPWASMRETPLTHSFCQYVVSSDQPLVVDDAAIHPLVYDNLAIPDLGVAAYAGLPLHATDGEVLGSFCVIDTKVHRWNEQELTLLQELADLAITEVALRSEVLERRRTEVALRASEARYRTLVDHFPSGAIFLFDRDLRYTVAGGAGLAATGFTPEQFVGRTLGDIFPPEIAARDEQHLREALDGQPTTVEAVLGTQTFLVQTLPVQDDQQQVIGGMVLTQDITERKHAEAERERLLLTAEQAQKEAEAAVLVRDQFLSIASHELRTPLTSVMGYATLLKKRLDSGALGDAVMHRQVDAIARQAVRLDGLINQLLDVSRLQRGQFDVELQPHDLRPLIAQAVEAFQGTLLDHQHQLVRLSQPDMPIIVQADPSRLEEILHNLLSNAVKYSTSDAPVDVSVTTDAHHVLVDVIDQGIGIPPEAQAHLFEPYYRAGNVSATSAGFGLGLYVVAELVQRHAGHIEVDSTPGVGSRFRVVLPRFLDA